MAVAPVITLLTDFGTADGYVGELKGVLTCAAPSTAILDISHDIPPHDVEAGRLALARYWRRFPAGTVHLVVVDPGVGGARAAIAVESNGQFLVGPDNGVLSPALFALDARTVRLPIPSGASNVFHGRDIFAPAAARLANGAALDSLGEPWHDPVRLRTPAPYRRNDGAVIGTVLTIDRFGNAITNLIARGAGEVEAGQTLIPIVSTYSDVAVGQVCALTGSSGLLEISVREGRADRELGLMRGAEVRLHTAS